MDGILLCLSTGAHRGWYDFHDSVQMLVGNTLTFEAIVELWWLELKGIQNVFELLDKGSYK